MKNMSKCVWTLVSGAALTALAMGIAGCETNPGKIDGTDHPVPGPCSTVICPPGYACDAETGDCVRDDSGNPCSAECPPGMTCDPETGGCVAINSMPTADAGADQEIVAGETAALDGSASHDPDGDDLGFAWRQAAGPAVALDDDGGARATFVTPDVAPGTRFEFELTVTDGKLEASDQVALIVTEPGSSNRAAVADAGLDQNVMPGATAALDGAASHDPDGDPLSFAWTQTGGMKVVLNGADTAHPTFIAPTVVATEKLKFSLVVSDGRKSSAADEVVVTVAPTVTEARVAVSWANASNEVNVDINWVLPNGTYNEVVRSGWGVSGTETGTLPLSAFEDGMHFLTLEFQGVNRFADLSYRIQFPGYPYEINQRLAGNFREIIAVDVIKGSAVQVFNTWTPMTQKGSAKTSGAYAIDILGGWRESSFEMNVDMGLRLPDGSYWGTWDHGWALEGLERIMVPRDILIEDGDYTAFFQLQGVNRWTDLSCFVDFLGESFALNERRVGSFESVMGFDVYQGAPSAVFNGWLDMGEPSAAQVSGRHPLEVVSSYRKATDEMNLDIAVQLPSGDYLERLEYGWGFQGYERTFVPAGSAIEDGVYTFFFRLEGTSRWSDADYHAKLMNWSYDHQERLTGGAEEEIRVQVESGVATELANTWRQ